MDTQRATTPDSPPSTHPLASMTPLLPRLHTPDRQINQGSAFAISQELTLLWMPRARPGFLRRMCSPASPKPRSCRSPSKHPVVRFLTCMPPSYPPPGNDLDRTRSRLNPTQERRRDGEEPAFRVDPRVRCGAFRTSASCD